MEYKSCKSLLIAIELDEKYLEKPSAKELETLINLIEATKISMLFGCAKMSSEDKEKLEKAIANNIKRENLRPGVPGLRNLSIQFFYNQISEFNIPQPRLPQELDSLLNNQFKVALK